jgi:hypothetical protein
VAEDMTKRGIDIKSSMPPDQIDVQPFGQWLFVTQGKNSRSRSLFFFLVDRCKTLVVPDKR